MLAIDGKDATDLGSGAVHLLLAGKQGTQIHLTVQTPGSAPRTVTVTRAPRSMPRL